MRSEWVWSRIGEGARARAARDYAQWIGENGFPPGMAACFARALRFREATILKSRGEELERLLLRGLPRLSARERGTFTVELHRTPRAKLLDQVMGALDGDTERLPELGDIEDLLLCLAAIELMSGGEPREELAQAIQLLERRAEQGLARAVEPLDAEALTAPDEDGVVPISGGPSPGPEPSQGPDSPAFTTLDSVLIRAMVSAINGTEGSLDADSLRDLVDEVVSLNDTRARSWFHLGYLDALREEQVASHAPGQNRERRAWYLAGFLLGRLRKDAWAEVRHRLDTLSTADRDVLLAPGGTPAGALLAQQFVPRLLEDGAVDEALRWFERYSVQVGPELVTQVLDWAKRTIAEGHPTAARRALETLAEMLPELERVWGPVSAEFHRLLNRRLAVCWRCEGRTEKAQQLVDRLLEGCEAGVERARLLGEKALIAMGLRSLEALALPQDLDSRNSFIGAIREVRSLLESSEADGGAVPSVLVALALPTVADPKAPLEEVETAISRLRDALETMGHDTPGFWDRTGLDTRARFYLCVLELRALEPGSAPGAVDRLHAALMGPEELPFDLAREAVANAMLCETPRSDEVARTALELWPRRMLADPELVELARRSSSARGEIGRALERFSRELIPEERWRAWDQILRGSLEANGRDSEAAVRALDELESLAREEGLEERFLGLLGDPGRWQPAWSRTEAKEAEVRLLERMGRFEQARGVLHDLTNLALSEGDLDAADLIDWLSALGSGEQELAPLRRRTELLFGTEAQQEQERPASSRGAPVRVLVIGGNEVQERYEEQLHAFLRERYPGCGARFVFSGWSGNWGPLLERIDRLLTEADVIVLLRFVRTQLGRTVRRIAGDRAKPWIPCTGHGRASLERALAEAIRVVRQHAAPGA